MLSFFYIYNIISLISVYKAKALAKFDHNFWLFSGIILLNALALLYKQFIYD